MRDRLFCLVEREARKLAFATPISTRNRDARQAAPDAASQRRKRVASAVRMCSRGSICACSGGRVKFLESPPLKRKNSDRPPFKQPEKWCAKQRAVNGRGKLPASGNRGNLDLQSSAGTGKFEKLLRSDPERWFGWCRVCLLFENSIVCQVY